MSDSNNGTASKDSLSLYDFFGKGGILSRSHPNYEYRPGQFEMARAVESALKNREHLVVEAGTGTGKTLAYLIPSLLSGKRVVISTGTKNLQEQLFFKDVAFLQTLFSSPLPVCYMKGRSNYVCRQKVYDAEREPILHGLEEVREFKLIRDWEATTATGDRSELRELPENSTLWPKLDARSDMCAGSKCKQYERCFITEMHRQAAQSNIIIVNHHLFFADLAVRNQGFGALIPEYSAVIFDEAHEIEDIAGQYFGISVSNVQFQHLVRDTADVSRQKMFSTPELDRSLIQLGERVEVFFHLFPREGRNAFAKHEALLEEHNDTYRELIFALDLVCGHLEMAQGSVEATLPLVRRAKLLGQALQFWVETHDSAYVYWTDRRLRSISLQAIPIDVSRALAARLFDVVPSVVLTSATLTVAGTFEYAQARLGLPFAKTLTVESQYDYAKQVLLYVPSQMPDPRSGGFAEHAAKEIGELVKASRGRAFVLFTSYAQMRQICDLLKPLLDYPVFLQGEAPRNTLIETYRSTPGAILFGTSSFWQGVDVQGEQLSCVIIDRLPFAVPSDPVIAARSEDIRKAGGDAFYEYQVPQAALTLKQGFGRLIRSASDRGVLALLDNRIVKQRYGRVFFQSLPAYRFTSKLREVQEFFHV
ncbi:MAG: ATP-dependent DNA helicase [Bryobacteraceae bacterium]